MAFGFKFGGAQSPVQKLVSGKLKEEEKQQLLGQLGNLSPVELIPLLALDDQSIASRGATLFLAKPDPEAVSSLLEAILEAPTGVASMTKVFQKCREEMVQPVIEAELAKNRADTARKLWELVLELPASLSEPYLERAINEAPGAPRLLALKRLLKAKGAEALRPLLVTCCENREASVRKEAVQALANLPGEDIFAVMLDRLSTDDSKEVRDFAGKYLQQYISKAPPEVRPRVLGKLLLAGDPEQRQTLVKTMFGSGKPDELLLGVLGFCKTLTGVQHRTVMGSMKAVGDTLVQPTLDALKSSNVDIRIQAVYLLETFADPRTVGPLVQMLRDPDWWVRIVVCETLARLKDPKIIPSLKEMFNDSDAKWAAIESVGELGTDAAVTALLPLTKDPSAEVRSAAITALRKVKDPRVEPALTEVSQRDTSIDVKLKAVELIREMKGDGRGTGSVINSKELNKPMEKMLAFLRERGGSDLHITPGEPPIIRVNGVLERVPSGKIDAEPAKLALFEMLDPVRKPILDKTGSVDFCYTIPGVGRYRANVMKMKRGYAGVFRVIPNRAPTFAELGMPKSLTDVGTYHQGIVLVTGPAGSGKTTTMTALINFINETRHAHVLTFEDPVEYIHQPKKALINQREIGKDSVSYAAAMRGALREDPDVIVVGDMRDPDTIRLALLAAETGHLVVATMQTTGAVATIEKLVEAFPVDEQTQVRGGLSESLKLIVSQILVPKADGTGRIGVYEILKSISSVRSLIRDNKTFQLPSTMVIGRSVGMQTIDGSLEERVKAGQITFETALQFAQNKENIMKIKAGPAPAAKPSAPGAAPGGAKPTTGTNPALGARAPAAAAPGAAKPAGAPAAAAARPGAPAAAPAARPAAPGTPGRKP